MIFYISLIICIISACVDLYNCIKYRRLWNKLKSQADLEQSLLYFILMLVMITCVILTCISYKEKRNYCVGAHMENIELLKN